MGAAGCACAQMVGSSSWSRKVDREHVRQVWEHPYNSREPGAQRSDKAQTTPRSKQSPTACAQVADLPSSSATGDWKWGASQKSLL